MKATVYLKDQDGKYCVEGMTGLDVSVDRQELHCSMGGASLTVRPFDTVTVRVGVERSRSHKPDVKLFLVHFGKMNSAELTSQETATNVRQSDIVRAVGTESSSTVRGELPAVKPRADAERSLYDFLISFIRSPEPVPEDRPACNDDRSSCRKTASQYVMRRWAPSAAQIEELELQRSPHGQLTDWSQSAEESDFVEEPVLNQLPPVGSQPAAGLLRDQVARTVRQPALNVLRGTTSSPAPAAPLRGGTVKVEDRYRDIIRAADQQVRLASLARSKQKRFQ
jgi:hypothetical protein